MEFIVLCLGIFTVGGIEGLAAITSRSSHCRDGWSHHGGSCYLFVTDDTDTWIEAVAHCSVLRGYLADILDEKENTFVKSELHRIHASGHYYISATDIEVEGHWVWPNSDERVRYMDWAPKEPQNAGTGENCAMLGAGLNFQWADVPCNSQRHFICKIRLDPGIDHGIIG